jgi:uncharacterized membrane protein YgaE (UPF0421/DUF939 family)
MQNQPSLPVPLRSLSTGQRLLLVVLGVIVAFLIIGFL